MKTIKHTTLIKLLELGAFVCVCGASCSSSSCLDGTKIELGVVYAQESESFASKVLLEEKVLYFKVQELDVFKDVAQEKVYTYNDYKVLDMKIYDHYDRYIGEIGKNELGVYFKVGIQYSSVGLVWHTKKA